MQTYLIFPFLGFLVGEVLSRTKLKLTISLFQGKTIFGISIRDNNPYGTFLRIGKKIIIVHHSTAGLIITGIAVLISNLSMILFSLGIVLHHVFKYKALFRH